MTEKHIKQGSLFSKLVSRLPVKPSGAQGSHAGPPPASGIFDLKLMFFIIDWSRVKVITGVFEEKKVGYHFLTRGKGTASSEVLDLLGIGADDKAVVFCIELPGMVPVLLDEVRKKLGFRGAGAGIAFTVPLSGINSPFLRVFKHREDSINVKDGVDKRRYGADRRAPHSYSLVITVVNRGHSAGVMNTAREAGATGGTILNARGRVHGEEVKFFGITVQDEREVVLILSDRKKKDPIMQALRNAYGLGKEARGLVFSLPVERVMSLNFEQELNA